MVNKFSASAKFAPLLGMLLLGACANQPTMTEINFGDSVRQMVRAQTYDPSTISTPSSEPVERTDGRMLEGAVEAYRGTVANPQTVGEEILINVGSPR